MSHAVPVPIVGRRQFVQASVAIGGGLVLGIFLPAEGRAAVAAPRAGGAPNAWLRIGGDNTITMIVSRVEMGQGVYTALPALLAEELEVPVASLRLEAAPPGEAYVNRFLGGQLTGGSSSVRDAWESMRVAGAQARTMLIAAAAGRWGIDPARCRAEDAVIVSDSGERLTFGDVAEAAAKLPVPAKVTLREPGQFRIVGRRIRRLDIPAKVTGTAGFAIDVKLTGMLHAALAQCPEVGGSLRSYDAARSQKMPGVRKVLRASSGVVVVADHFWQALKARDALAIEWDAGPGATLDNASIRATLAEGSGGAGRPARVDGDAGAALKSAALNLSAVYEVPLLAHATMEPMNCTADVGDDGCDVYAPTQGPARVQAAAAQAAGLAPERVRVYPTLLGGGFGRRIEVDYVPAAVEASRAVGRPVKLIWTREDDMRHDAYRPPARNEVAAGLDAAGKPVAWHLRLIAPSATARLFPSLVENAVDPLAVEAAQNLLYDIDNVTVEFVRREVGITVGYWRSISHFANCFTVESFMDELAAAAGQDPYEFRHGLLGRQPRAKTVLELAATRAGWGRAAAGRHQGIALMEGYGSYLAQVAEVSVSPVGEVKVHRIVCAADCGRMVNPAIVESQVEGGIVFGLTAALWGDITVKDGRVEEGNFHQYRLMRLNEAPQIDVHLLDSTDAPGGMGEPSTALVAPAVCNAIFAATGKRLRMLPIGKQPGLKA